MNPEIFFTADPHLLDDGMAIIYGFDDANHLLETYRANWNSVVKNGDVVYVIGDFVITGLSKKRSKEIDETLSGFKGNIHLIKGNHDSQAIFDSKRILSISTRKHKIIKGQRIIMDHYPMYSWQFKSVGALMLHGHTHGSLQYKPEETNIMDVGVANWNFTPITYDQIVQKLKQKGSYKEPIRN